MKRTALLRGLAALPLIGALVPAAAVPDASVLLPVAVTHPEVAFADMPDIICSDRFGTNAADFELYGPHDPFCQLMGWV